MKVTRYGKAGVRIDMCDNSYVLNYDVAEEMADAIKEVLYDIKYNND